MSPRRIRISFVKRGVACVARLLEEEAPATCEVVWAALPKGGPAKHAKYASNEVYCLVPPFATIEPPLENPTIIPSRGDVLYFDFPSGMLDTASRAALGLRDAHFIDLAVFYDRNNLLLNPGTGFVPGNVFAIIEENLEGMAAACRDFFRGLQDGEELLFERESESERLFGTSAHHVAPSPLS